MFARFAKNKSIVIGLTGGIATGKSTAVDYLRSLDYKIFDSDLVVKDLWDNDQKLKSQILNKYNIDIDSTDGKKTLAKLMFTDQPTKEYVESLIHPLVFDAITDFKKNNKTEKVLIIDMPLLFEVNYQTNVDKTLLIYVNSDVQLKRVMKRDKITKEEALLKINAQISIEEKHMLSNYVIENEGSIEDLHKEIDKTLRRIIDES